MKTKINTFRTCICAQAAPVSMSPRVSPPTLKPSMLVPPFPLSLPPSSTLTRWKIDSQVSKWVRYMDCSEQHPRLWLCEIQEQNKTEVIKGWDTWIVLISITNTMKPSSSSSHGRTQQWQHWCQRTPGSVWTTSIILSIVSYQKGFNDIAGRSCWSFFLLSGLNDIANDDTFVWVGTNNSPSYTNW